jgi:hypothetical protein
VFVSQHAKSDRNHTLPAHSPAAADAPEAAAACPAGSTAGGTAPSPADIKRWRQYLADERAEARVYRDLAQSRRGEERDILLALAEAEGRH